MSKALPPTTMFQTFGAVYVLVVQHPVLDLKVITITLLLLTDNHNFAFAKAFWIWLQNSDEKHEYLNV